MGFWKKLRFWRRRDVGPNFQKRVEELEKKLEENDAKQEQQ